MGKPEQLDFFSLLTNDPVCPICNGVFKKKRSTKIYCSGKCCDKQYLIRNKKKIKERRKKYSIKNKEKIRERNKKYFIKNKEKLREQCKKYRIKNKEKIKEKGKKFYNKNKNNANFKLKLNLRGRINKSLIKQKTIKSKNTLELLGCSWKKARKHLESQFKEGMTWDNYGYKGWHIDHIIPCSSFDLTNIEEQKKCFNYKNLQPLWWHDNLSKGTKIVESNQS